jgi:competence protein ComEC
MVPLAMLFFMPRRRRVLLLSSLCIAIFFAGMYYFRSTQYEASDGDLRSYNDRGVVEIRGRASSPPEIGPTSTRISLSCSGIRQGLEWLPVSGTAMLTVPRYPAYRYGDVLIATGELRGRPQAGPASSNESAYWDDLANHEVFSTMFYPEVELTTRGHGGGPTYWLFAARENLSRTLARVLPEPQASLAQGIALGMRSSIPADLKTDFARTGTTHLLAISGVNLTIVAGILVTIALRLFGRRHYVYIWLTIGIVWLYTFLTGAGAPVVRAAIMLTLFLTADLLGRQRSAVIALAVAAAIMTALRPGTLRDPSFQLSFAAMAGLIFVFPPLQSLSGSVLDRIPGDKVRALCSLLADSLGISLAAVIATLPLTTHYFGAFSWLGPLATFVTMPAMSAIIVTSVLAGTLGLAIPAIGLAVAWLAWLPLSYMILTVSALAAVPGTSLQVGPISTTLVIASYTSLVGLVVFYREHRRVLRFGRKVAMTISTLPARWVVPPLAVTALLAWLIFATMPDNNLHVSFLDVGQGDAILIEKGNRQILVDGGPGPQAVMVELSKRMPFWDRSIDLAILTHPDADHLGGLVEVVKRFNVTRVAAASLSDNSALFREWQTVVESMPGGQHSAASGQSISLGKDVSLSVLNPDSAGPANAGDSLNTRSIVLRLVMGKVSFLLTGDLDTDGERALVTQGADLNSTVLKIGHHGSLSSTSDALLAVAAPRAAVISVGKANTYGHPNQDVLSRLTQKLGVENVYRTDERGTIEFITNGERLWVKTAR